MKTSLHLLVGSAAFNGAAKIYGQNMLLPAQAGVPPQFAAVVYAAHDLHTESPAAALVIKTAFSRPMMPDIAPGSPVWNDIVRPHLATLVAAVGQQAGNPRGPRLGGVAARVAAMLKNQPAVLSGGGTLLVPEDHLPPASAPQMFPPASASVPAFPVTRRSTLRLAA